jgi:hypothetical protein
MGLVPLEKCSISKPYVPFKILLVAMIKYLLKLAYAQGGLLLPHVQGSLEELTSSPRESTGSDELNLSWSRQTLLLLAFNYLIQKTLLHCEGTRPSKP